MPFASFNWEFTEKSIKAVPSRRLLPRLDKGSTLLSLLAVTAEAGPRHGVQPGFGDGTLAGLAHSKCAPVDPRQGFFDRSEEATVRLV
jgi:hypothetical protein